MNFKKAASKIINFINYAERFKTGKGEAYLKGALKMAYQKGQIDLLEEQIKEKKEEK